MTEAPKQSHQSIIDWENWDENECKRAWKKLKDKYSAIELLYVFYGGLRSKDITFEGLLIGIKKHYQSSHYVEIKFDEPSEVCESSIRYEPKIPVSTIKDIVNTYEFTDEEKKSHAGVYDKEELEFIGADFLLRCAEE